MPVITPKQKINQTRMFGEGAIEIRLAGDNFDECAEAAETGIETSCCGDDHEDDVDHCDMCGMPMVDNLCDCCADNMRHTHGHGHGHGHDDHDGMGIMYTIGLKETYSFDKFMDNILLKENKRTNKGDSPIRERIRRHQEKPLNRIRYGVKL